jgi:hypothetical protein
VRRPARRRIDVAHGSPRKPYFNNLLDLFDPRFKVFDATRWFIAKAYSLGKVTSEQEREFTLATIDAEFLFNDELAAYIEEIRQHVGKLQAYNAMLEGPERGDAEVLRLKEVQWFSEQADVLKQRFRLFLKLDD